MSTVVLPPLPADLPVTRPGVLRLTVVEMRKIVDTRSGRWLVGIIGLLALGSVAVSLLVPDSNRSIKILFEFASVPVALLLPVLGILAVTSEWSQRTALVTFTLVPRRELVTVAKVTAAIAWSVVFTLAVLLLAAAGAGLADLLGLANTGWDISAAAVGAATLALALGVVMGTGFGLLLMNTPAAIVLYFALPIAMSLFAVLADRLSWARDAIPWIDINAALLPLSENAMTLQAWQHLAVAGGLWIALPVLLGGLRLNRREVS